MAVDINDILHVLAHELRTPVGIAHGYVRLLLDDRLATDSDRRRALEQMQKALGRLSTLSYETTALAECYEQRPEQSHHVDAQTLIGRVADAQYEWPVMVDTSGVSVGHTVQSRDPESLVKALVGMVQATARELRGTTCDVIARVVESQFEMIAGPEDMLEEMAAGPTAPAAGPVALERGGLGLALVHAAVVLDEHGAERWTTNGSRQTIGLRLPLEER